MDKKTVSGMMLILLVGIFFASFGVSAAWGGVSQILRNSSNNARMSSSRSWAILIHGPQVYTKDTDYMYHILDEHYNFTIYYLHTNTSSPRVDNSCTKENVRYAINTWLPSHSSANDTILIFFLTHGGGYQAYEHTSSHGSIEPGLYDGRWDEDHDEGGEHLESNITLPTGVPPWLIRLYPELVDVNQDGFEDCCRNIDSDPYIEVDLKNDGSWDTELGLADYDQDGVKDDLLIDSNRNDLADLAINANVSLASDGEDADNDGYIDGVDINEDGNQDDYVGVDECLRLRYGERYWDDEIRSDLNSLEGKYKTLIFITQSCVEGNLSCFGGGLIDDLSHENRIIMTASNETSVAYADLPPKDGYSAWAGPFMHALHGTVDADTNPKDGHVSIKEAWDYACDHDIARQQGLETPWLDDDGNGLPTFANGTDVLDPDDGTLAADTWFQKKVSHLEVKTWCLTTDEELSNVDIWLDDNQTALPSPQLLHVAPTNHTIKVKDPVYEGNWKYIFDHWSWENSTSNPITADVSEDVCLTAYYNRTSYSGCPFVYTWNGTEYVIDNNLLPASETSGGADVEDHYKLEQTPVLENGKYKLLISEFEQEHSYLDRVQLIAVDHQSDVNTAVSPYGEILTYKEPNPPVIAVDNDNNDVTSLLEAIDGNYYEGYAGDCLILDFGNLNVQDGAKLVMRADLPPEEEKWTVHIQVLNDTGNWETVGIIIPRVYWATEIVDLHNYLPNPNGDLKVRLYFTAHHKIDYVGLDTSPQADYELHYANLVYAVHSTQGNVKSELSESDCVYAELLPGEQIELAFTLPENSKDERTFVIYAKGHYYNIAS